MAIHSTIYRLNQFLCLLYNPVVVVYVLVLAMTWSQFPELSFFAITHRALSATMDAVTFAVVDSIVSLIRIVGDSRSNFYSIWQIYGNWMYPLVSIIFLPIWISFFSVLCIRPADIELRSNIKLKAQ